jgi:hypothetical protein
MGFHPIESDGGDAGADIWMGKALAWWRLWVVGVSAVMVCQRYKSLLNWFKSGSGAGLYRGDGAWPEMSSR